MVKPGGKLIYATCSILPRENQEQVQFFLSSEAGKEFKLEKEEPILPSKSGYDGFYISVMERQPKKA
jgi:16S rRNA (cytosine967-C5)-methyltransferase